jgi:hypothetical protein
VFFTVWGGGFFGGLFKATGVFPGRPWTPSVFFGALAFFGIPLVAYVGKKLNYARTEYRFFPDRLEFEEGFFTINQKVIKFKDVKEITLRKSIFQQIYGLGSIYLATLATGSSPGSHAFTRSNVFTLRVIPIRMDRPQEDDMAKHSFEPRMSFSHGRTKPVVVEKVKRRIAPPTVLLCPSCGAKMKIARLAGSPKQLTALCPNCTK